jgi:hypothetical protein
VCARPVEYAAILIRRHEHHERESMPAPTLNVWHLVTALFAEYAVSRVWIYQPEQLHHAMMAMKLLQPRPQRQLRQPPQS